MPLTKLDAGAALVVIDLQKGILALPTVHHAPAVLSAAIGLATAFRRRSRPVALVTAVGIAPGRTEQSHDVSGLPPDWFDLAPELAPAPTDMLITKRRWGAFTDTDLEARLKAAGVTQLVLSGIATSIGVESTARHAYELGFNVALAVDAMTDIDPGAHANSVERISPALGETGSTADTCTTLCATFLSWLSSNGGNTTHHAKAYAETFGLLAAIHIVVLLTTLPLPRRLPERS